jgi:drug/metabolite transporter (DMT)-like permease
VLFGLLTSLSIGTSDLFGRRLANARGPIVTGVLLQSVALATSLVAVVVVASRFSGSDLAIGIASGFGTGFGLAAYFAGVSRSSSAIVAPIVATLSSVVPYTYALLRGAAPTALGIVGALVAIAGVGVITVGRVRAASLATGVRWGVVSGLGFGVGLSVVIDASDEGGAWPAVGQRLAAVVLMLAVARATRTVVRVPRRLVATGVVSGVFAGLSTVFFLLGVEVEPTSTVVAGSVFPAFIVLVGRFVYGDEVLPRQVVGIGVVLVGVVLVSVP